MVRRSSGCFCAHWWLVLLAGLPTAVCSACSTAGSAALDAGPDASKGAASSNGGGDDGRSASSSGASSSDAPSSGASSGSSASDSSGATHDAGDASEAATFDDAGGFDSSHTDGDTGRAGDTGLLEDSGGDGGGAACGTQTCGPTQFCVHQFCCAGGAYVCCPPGGGVGPCSPVPDGGCSLGYVPGNGNAICPPGDCIFSGCEQTPAPYCVDTPPNCQPCSDVVLGSTVTCFTSTCVAATQDGECRSP